MIGRTMAWRLEGTYFENCNCDLICPCIAGLGLLADNDRCVYVFAFHVENGDVDGVDVSGLSVVLVGDSPPDMSSMSYGLIIAAAAGDEQRRALEDVFSGRRGGPPAGVGEPIAVETAPIEYVDDGRRHRVRVGGDVEVEIEDAPRAGADSDEPRRLTGLGHFVSSTLTIATARRSYVRAFDYEFSNEGKNAHSAPFAWVG